MVGRGCRAGHVVGVETAAAPVAIGHVELFLRDRGQRASVRRFLLVAGLDVVGTRAGWPGLAGRVGGARYRCADDGWPRGRRLAGAAGRLGYRAGHRPRARPRRWEESDHPAHPRLRSGCSLARVLLAPFPLWRRDVERIANVSYGDAGRANRLDLYRHRSHPAGAPVLIHFHGGHFRMGAKSREARAIFYRLAGHGWVCASANYRLREAGRFPNSLIDAKKAIAWARRHAPEYDADPTVLFVAGSSAGAHLASMAALTPNDPAFQPGFAERGHVRQRSRLPLRLLRRPRFHRAAGLLAVGVRASRRAPVLRCARHQRHRHVGRGGRTFRRTTARRLRQPGRLCAAARRGARL